MKQNPVDQELRIVINRMGLKDRAPTGAPLDQINKLLAILEERRRTPTFRTARLPHWQENHDRLWALRIRLTAQTPSGDARSPTPTLRARIESVHKPLQGQGEAEASKSSEVLQNTLLFTSTLSKSPRTPIDGGWIKELLASTIFKQQVDTMGKLVPKEDQITNFLSAMEKRGNSVLLTTLSADITLPVFRLRGLVSSLSRLLNVDGYAVLHEDRDSETISLDRKLLARQFEIKA